MILPRGRVPQPSAPMIEVEALTKRYGTFTAVRGLSFAVRPARCWARRPNGAGKTTTLRCMAGIIPPSEGKVRIAGHDIAADPVARSAPSPSSRTSRGFRVPDRAPAPGLRRPDLRGRRPRGPRTPLLEELELAEKADELPGELSRGMKQKLVIACGLLHSPRVMFFDEPLTGLDPLGIRRMKDSIVRRAREGRGDRPELPPAPPPARRCARTS